MRAKMFAGAVAALALLGSDIASAQDTVRLAIGCRRGRLLRQLLTEGLILSVLSSVSGLVVAYFCRNLLVIFFPLSSVIATNLSGQMDWRVLAFSAGVCLVSTLIFALVPALQTTNLDIAGALKAESGTSSGSRAKSRLRSTMVLVQVSLSFILIQLLPIHGPRQIGHCAGNTRHRFGTVGFESEHLPK